MKKARIKYDETGFKLTVWVSGNVHTHQPIINKIKESIGIPLDRFDKMIDSKGNTIEEGQCLI